MRFPKLSNVMIAMGLVILFWGVTATVSNFKDDYGSSDLREPTELNFPHTQAPVFFPMTVTEQVAGKPAEDGFTVFSSGSTTQTPAGQIPLTGTVYIPDRIIIPKIYLDAPVVEATRKLVTVEGQVFEQWLAPDAPEAGWHSSSATLGIPGNTVINGHHNAWGNVFGRLVDLEKNDIIVVSSGNMDFVYEVSNKMILQETYAELEVREENARWLQPSDDERLTLVTCWPKESNTHRLIIVAKPVAHGENLTEYK